MDALSTAPRLFVLVLSSALLAIGAWGDHAQTALAAGPAEDHGGSGQGLPETPDSHPIGSRRSSSETRRSRWARFTPG